MPIYVNMACGLANRMFQYSYYLYLKHSGYDTLVDYYTSGKLAHEDVMWEEIFPNAKYDQASKLRVWIMAGGNDIISKIRRRYRSFSPKVQQMPTAFTAEMPQVGKQYIIGVFQNAHMVEAIRDIVLDKFRFFPFQDDYNKDVLKKMQDSESVAIHIRKGKDYQSRIWYQNTCPLSYYLAAIAYVRLKVKCPKFFVFADNKEWVRENFTGFEYTLIDGNPGDGWGSHFDMQLISCAKHVIMSNSTYSWWGTFLNASKDKVVVIPKIWFNPESCDDFTSAKLLCKDWTQI